MAPHRLRQFKLRNDLDFVTKLRGVLGLCVDPPAHAIALSVDEKPQIQALGRTRPGLRTKKGRAGTMTRHDKRNGTATLFAALDVPEGKIIGRCIPRHRRREFIRFLNTIEREVPAGKDRSRPPRQRRRPQAPQGARLARPPSALFVPLCADHLLVAERGRGHLSQAAEAPP